MSRWIDADEIENAKFQEENLRGMGEHITYRVGWNEAIESILENAPSIEIIRCGECRYWHSGECWGIPYRGDYDTSIDTKADDFCSYGERNADPNTLNTLDALDDNCSEKPNNLERSSE